MQTFSYALVRLLSLSLALTPLAALAAPAPKIHTVTLGPARKVPYTPPGAGQTSTEVPSIRIRTLFVDARQKEWTTGELHDVTDRSFTIRRALRLNDALPNDANPHWTWQPGPWLLVDRTTGHITALHLPDFDNLISDAVWFRDYAAYCGVATTVKGGLFAIVAQLGVRRPVVQKQLGGWPDPSRPDPVCKPAIWQRAPIRVTLQPSGADAMAFDVVGAASLVEEGDTPDAN